MVAEGWSPDGSQLPLPARIGGAALPFHMPDRGRRPSGRGDRNFSGPQILCSFGNV
jgi:hypothetical protein